MIWTIIVVVGVLSFGAVLAAAVLWLADASTLYGAKAIHRRGWGMNLAFVLQPFGFVYEAGRWLYYRFTH